MFFSDIQVPSTYYLIDSPKKLSWLAKELLASDEFCFDIETNHPTWKGKRKLPEGYDHKICGIAFSWGRTEVSTPWRSGMAAYVPLTKTDDSPYWRGSQDAAIALIKEVLESEVPKVAHNGKFDVFHLADLLDIWTRNLWFDTMLAHALIDEDRVVSSHALKSDFSKEGKLVKMGVADAYLHPEASIFKGGLNEALDFYDPQLRRYSKVPLDRLYPYACADADLTLALEFVLGPLLRKEGLLDVFDTIVMPLQHVLTIMELHGVPLDIERAIEVKNEQARIMKECEKEIHRLSGVQFNVSSVPQLGKVLFEDMGPAHGLIGRKNERGAWVTDGDVLESLNHPIAKPLLDFRRAEQIKGLYAEAALDKVKERTNGGMIGWVHPTYWMDSATGRLKLTDPNLTTLPRPENGGLIVKGMWVADEDHVFVFSDFSQIELRVIAHLSMEPVWVDGFNAGHDMHSAMAKRIWNLPCAVEEVGTLYPDKRSKAKTVNFGIAYGESEQGLSGQLGITVEEARKLIHEEYFGAAPVLKQWIENVHDFIKKNGYVNNIFGRRRHLPDAMTFIPDSVPWPSKGSEPKCYRDGPYPALLGIDPTDIHSIHDHQIAELIKVRGIKNLVKCTSCPHIRSCFVNREVKYARAKVNRALRQGVNAPVQGSAVDMASLSLCWIHEDFKKHQVGASPILHIHDELVVYSLKTEVERVRSIMEYNMTTRMREYTTFRVPLLVDTKVVQRWSDKEKKKK